MATPRLYTFILEFRGGTYISQTRSSSVLDATSSWLQAQPEAELASWKLSKNELETLCEKNTPVALEGVVGVWCVSGTINGYLALLNIVDTRPV